MLKLREDEVSTPVRQPWAFLRRRSVLFVLIAVVLLIVILMVRHLQHRTTAGPGRGFRGAGGGMNAPIAVAVAPVTTGDIRVRIPALGTITPLATVTVRTQISGQLQKIAFKEGQLVHEGEFLAQIDPRPYAAALNQAKGNLRRDTALLTDARLNLKRYQELVREDSIAQQQVDTQQAQVDQYEGIVQADEAQVSTATVNLQYTHIVSPVTGRVGLRQVDQGNYVTAGDTNGIVVITELQPITALFSVPEDEATNLMRHLQSGATLTVEAFDRGNSAKLADGKLTTIDNQIDTATGTVKLRAQFDNKDGVLFPNQFVNIELLENTLTGQIIMPNAAVHRGAPNGVVNTFVYLVNSADSTVAVRPVTLGVVDGERVAVTKGLAAGDVVVTEGGDRLRDGAPVTLPGANPVNAGGGAQRPGGSAPGAQGANGFKPGAQGQGGRRFRRPGGAGGPGGMGRPANQPPNPQ